MKPAWERYGIIRKALTLFFAWFYFTVLFFFCVGLIDIAIMQLLISLGYTQEEAFSVWRFYYFILEVLKAIFGSS